MFTESDMTYDEIYAGFRWNIPHHYNMATDVCDRHAVDPDRVAMVGEAADGGPWQLSFRDVQRRANALANVLTGLGLERGDRVMVMLPQDPWAATAHVACWKAGFVSVPTSILFGPDAIAYRLGHVSVRVVITDRASLPTVVAARANAPSVKHVLLIDGSEPGADSLPDLVAKASDAFENVDTLAEEPAFLNFTSGTTGHPKGVLQAHRSMLGHLPGIELPLEFFPQPGDCMWTPADWSWLAGLMDVLMPAWYHGVPVLTFRAARFDPEQAFWMMGRHRVRTALLTPTMLRMMRQVQNPVERYGLNLRVVVSGGESVGKELHDWAERVLQAPINEIYGQTECNLVLGNCASIMDTKPGSLGRSMPGHRVAIVDNDGEPLGPGETGNIAVRVPDPVMMLRYWDNPAATREKFNKDWLITGDLGKCDEEGYFWFHGRTDDIITSSGYRIGPAEIEDALTRHPAVVLAAVVGVPDEVRGEAIKAFVTLRDGWEAGTGLSEKIRDFVRSHLAKHEVPHEIVFVDSLPTSVSGKIIRRELRDGAVRRE